MNDRLVKKDVYSQLQVRGERGREETEGGRRGRNGEKENGRERWKDGVSQRAREQGREAGREGGRKGGREGGRGEYRERRRERERETGRGTHSRDETGRDTLCLIRV